MRNKEVCLILGAGAGAVFNISTGDSFARHVLRIKGENDLVETVIRNHYKSKLESYSCAKELWYPKYQTSHIGIDSLLKCAIMKSLQKKNKEFDTKIMHENYVKLHAKKVRSAKKKKDLIYSNPNYMGILDESFHTLISPKTLGPHKFWRVLATYTAAYLTICMDVLKKEEPPKKDDYNRLLQDPCVTYKEIENKISLDFCEVDSYYKVLRDYSHKLNAAVITTNYTPICEIVLNGKTVKPTNQVDSDNTVKIAYIHGRLNWFECPYTLQVYDTECEDDREAFEKYLLFPYIFIQSGVKPIVERKQLEEYCKALQLLDDASEVAIIGYSLNVDDNHLNSLLHSYAMRNGSCRRITYFAFEDFNMDKQAICEKLRIPQEKTANLNIIHINKDKSTKEFDSYLASLSK